MKVLIVDDEYYARKAMIKMLKEWDKELAIIGDVETGTEAIECINTEVPDVMFTDIRMPDLDGLELAQYVKKKYPSCVVFIISGYSDVQHALKKAGGSVKEYLTKPVKKLELFKHLNAIRDNIQKS